MTIMPESARRAAIEKALEAEEARPDAERRYLPWKEDREKCTVIEIELAAVLLNPRSHRIRAQLEGHELHDTVRNAPDSEQAQQVLAGLLRATDGYEDILTSLRDEGQREPGVITRAGILVNGNTRAVALRELDRQYIRAMVLPKHATSRQISELELRLQVRRDFKQDYTFTNQLLFVKECLHEAHWGYERVAKEVGYATRLGVSKGKDKVHQDERVLNMIEELRTMSGKRYAYTFFDDEKQALEEIDKEFEQLKIKEPEAALDLRTARMVGVLCKLGYRDLRHVRPDFIKRYLAPEIEDNERLSLLTEEFLRSYPTDEPDGLELLGSSRTDEGPSSEGLLAWLTRTAGNNAVSVNLQGKKWTWPRDELVEELREAIEGGVTAAKEDKKREDLIDQPSRRLGEARRKIRAASEAYKKAKRDPRFDNARIKRLQYYVRKLNQDIARIGELVEKEVKRRTEV